ncbi:hypothetical protein NEF87_004692 [Candidatus Lokiarchaeum ossiferum]|uniref:ABC3 transporter permease protein domain-containing protein n=1 Tax=Candidatus Lokiarchaeum ossiferum TaxID=2951803 RepID=A0ABY6HY08_9ARCH|nr:hypothetical protein NEF87_004692 [Candidatus Lokiarchaeum sp. B-35]
MKFLFPFYVRLSLQWIKKSYLIIISVSVTLSMILATNLVIESGISEDFTAHMENSSEFIIGSPESTTIIPENIAAELQDYENRVLSISQTSEKNSKLFSDIDSYKFFMIHAGWGSFGLRENYPISKGSFDFGSLTSRINFFVYPENYYRTERFAKNFILMEGSYPKTETEVLVPYTYNLLWNYQIGDDFDMTYFVGDSSVTEFRLQENGSIQIAFPNPDIIQRIHLNSVKIVGFYVFSSRLIDILGETYQMDLTYEKIMGDDLGSNNYDDTPLFFYSNFSQSSIANHPAYHFYDTIFQNNSLFNAVMHQTYNILGDSNIFHSGITLARSLDEINYNDITSYENQLNQIHQVLQTSFKTETYLRTYRYSINNLRSYVATMRLYSFAINLPLMIFTIFIAFSSMQNWKKSRLDSFLQLSIKGMTKKQIRSQMILEIISMSVICVLISILLSFILFFPIRSTLISLFFPTLSVNQIQITISPFWSAFTFLFAFITISISYKHLFKTLKKTEIQDIYENQNQEYLLGIYNENTTYAEKKPKKNSKKHKESQYEDSVEETEKSNRKISYFLFPFILVPLFVYGLALYSANHDLSNDLSNFVNDIFRSAGVTMVFALILPILIVLFGIYRFLIVESPRRYAKLCCFLSKPLNRELNYLMGLEMIRRKEFRYIIIMLVVFLSSTFILNPYSTSSASYPKVIANSLIGADITIEIQFDETNLGSQISHTAFDSQIQNIFDEENISLEQPLSVVTQRAEIYAKSGSETLVQRRIHYFNFSQFLKFNSHQNNHFPSTVLDQSIEDVVEYNKDPNSSDVGIVCGSAYDFYKDLEDFPPFVVNMTYFNSNLMKIESIELECKLLARTDSFSPVSNYESGYDYGWDLFIDITHVLPFNCTLLAQEYVFLGNKMDKSDDSILNNDKLTEFLETETKQYDINEVDYQYMQYSTSFALFKTKLGYSLYSLLLLAFSLTISQGIMFIHSTRNNFVFYGHLLTRGVSRKQVYLFGLGQLLLMFFLATIITLITTTLPIILALKVLPGQIVAQDTYRYEWAIGKYPVLLNWPLLGINVFIIFLGTIILYSVFIKSHKTESFFEHTKQQN